MTCFRTRALSVLALACAPASVACSAGDAPPPTCTSQQASTIETLPALGRPARLVLTGKVLTRLQARAAANDPAWTALKAHCDALAPGSANVPSGSAYPDLPVVGQGYQGDGYLPEVLALGLCYQTLAATDAGTAATYAAAGDRILQAMATPVSAGGQAPSTDSGYGIRNYGVGMAFGFDWLYPGLQDSTKSAVIAALDSWIDWYDASGFSNTAPVGNYFAGYILAKTATGIATDPDNAKAAGYWSDVQTKMYPGLVESTFAPAMKGGGWPEGWEYGPRSVENYALFFSAVESGKGLDWFDQIPHVRDEATYMTYFAWPSLKHMDDQGTVHSGVTLTPPGTAASAMASLLGYHGDPYAPTAKSFAASLLATNHDALDPWQAFLYVDPAQPQSSYVTQPLSYFAAGPNHVAVRSTWQTDAVWESFVPGTYIDSGDSGEQSYNSGAVAIVAGDTPILVNATGQLPQVDGADGENIVYSDSYDVGTRALFNTFGATGAKQVAADPTQAATHAQGYEDNGSFVHARGVSLEQMYSPSGIATQWTRDFTYVRPGVFVIYDRTTANASDRWLSWHTEVAPVSVATSDPTQSRFDVTGGSFRMLLPASAAVKTIPIAAGITRLETHSSNASEDWLTVVTAGATPEQVRLSVADGNVTSGALVGVHVLTARNAVVLFNSDHAAVQKTSTATYTVTQTADADHVLFDMAPQASGYSVVATATGSKISVAVKPGGAFPLTAQGTLAFVVGQGASVAPAPTPPPPATIPGGNGSDGGAPASPPTTGGTGTPGTPPTTPPAQGGAGAPTPLPPCR